MLENQSRNAPPTLKPSRTEGGRPWRVWQVGSSENQESLDSRFGGIEEIHKLKEVF